MFVSDLMRLAYHFLTETQGGQTFTARAIKAVARGWYYRKMASECGNQEVARRLDRADREVNDLRLLSPYGDKNVFRSFLSRAKDEPSLGERIRLLREVVLQLRKCDRNTHTYEINLRHEIRRQLDMIETTIGQFDVQTLRGFHLSVEQVLEKKNVPRLQRLLADEPGLAMTGSKMLTVPVCTALNIRLSTIFPPVAVWNWDRMVAEAKKLF